MGGGVAPVNTEDGRTEDAMTPRERAEPLMNRLLSGCRLAPEKMDAIVDAVAAEIEQWASEERSLEREACAVVAETLPMIAGWAHPPGQRIAQAIRDRSEE